ncbi:MAG: WYL domain-containing protein [Vampirovibrionales bacterium]|nr:WYL domain-containing protein [Vampirovibrionales bacterium]
MTQAASKNIAVAQAAEMTASGALPASVNSTAYRIFKMLVWLSEKPLSVQALNECFLADPAIGKKLSSDSIWLYINTLKALGCDIIRPMRSNGFRYELAYHPFGTVFEPGQLDLLVSLKKLLETHAPHQTAVHFDRFIRAIIKHSAQQEQEAFLALFFKQSRSLDYENNQAHINALQQAIQANKLLSLSYLSPLKGKERFFFLPDGLLYQNGVLYVLGQQQHRAEPAMLRVDRVERFESVERPEIARRLMAQQEQEQTVRIRFYGVNADEMPSFDFGETIEVYTMADPLLPSERVKVLEMSLRTRHLFLLRQKILASGHAFKILSPASFADSMEQGLSQLARLYEFDGES